MLRRTKLLAPLTLLLLAACQARPETRGARIDEGDAALVRTVGPVAPSAAEAAAPVVVASSSAPVGAHLEGTFLIAPDGAPHPAPKGTRWVAVSGDVALLAPSTDSYEACELRDARTAAKLRNVTTDGTAAGGTTVSCTGLAANGRVVLFANSRGTYAKDARTDKRLPCGDAIYADDASSCVQIDASPLLYDVPTAAPVPFIVEACALPSGPCRPLLTIPRGLNRVFGSPRPWQVAYCTTDRVAVAYAGQISTFELPSGKRLSRSPAPADGNPACP